MLETWRQIKAEASEIMPQDVRSWGRDGDRGRQREERGKLSQRLSFTSYLSVSRFWARVVARQPAGGGCGRRVHQGFGALEGGFPGGLDGKIINLQYRRPGFNL